MTAKSEKRLLALLRRLPQEQVQQLLEYGEFLVQRYGLPEEVGEPENISRPHKETVVQAIKRLCTTYPMLDRGMLFNETAMLMSQHMLQGKDAVEVIDELELLFRRHYEIIAKAEKGTDSE